MSGCRVARCCSSCQEAQPSCSRIFIPRVESVPRWSRSFIACATARRPMSKALPSSPSLGPCPPVRQICPCPFRPIAADPVPATSTITGPLPAAASAVSKSVKMLTATPGNALSIDARGMLSRLTRASPPSIPDHPYLLIPRRSLQLHFVPFALRASKRPPLSRFPGWLIPHPRGKDSRGRQCSGKWSFQPRPSRHIPFLYRRHRSPERNP